MSLFDSVRVLGAMARVTASTVVDVARGALERRAIDERARWFGARVIDLLAIDLHVSGAERVPRDGSAFVYMSNHQSHLDIPILYAALPSPTIRMLAKTELFRIPVWGPALRAAEFVEVDRGDHTRAMRSLDRAAQLVREGVSIYLAPEGTRTRDGSVGPLKKGGFHLALETGAPIVPVAIRGTFAILPRDELVMRRGCRVEVEIGAPIPVRDCTADHIPELAGQVREFLVNFVEDRASAAR